MKRPGHGHSKAREQDWIKRLRKITKEFIPEIKKNGKGTKGKAIHKFSRADNGETLLSSAGESCSSLPPAEQNLSQVVVCAGRERQSSQKAQSFANTPL